MGIEKPYHLTVRPFSLYDFTSGRKSQYIRHNKYSSNASTYIRSYMILHNELIELLNYIEPASGNLKTYSLKVQDLMVRVCTELESNFKSILSLNKYSRKTSSMTIRDYYMLQYSHQIGNYSVKFPIWSGNVMDAVRQPFRGWWQPDDKEKPWKLGWYQSYNLTKHDKANNLNEASLENLIDAFSALCIVISAQYMDTVFTLRYEPLVVTSGYQDGFDDAIGGYFGIKYAGMWPDDEYYDFDWESLKTADEPIQQFDYDELRKTLQQKSIKI
jgi:hypothetical protein